MTVYWGGLIPSQVFGSIEYQSYLDFASAYELENDIITQKTLDKMGHRLSTEDRNKSKGPLPLKFKKKDHLTN